MTLYTRMEVFWIFPCSITPMLLFTLSDTGLNCYSKSSQRCMMFQLYSDAYRPDNFSSREMDRELNLDTLVVLLKLTTLASLKTAPISSWAWITISITTLKDRALLRDLLVKVDVELLLDALKKPRKHSPTRDLITHSLLLKFYSASSVITLLPLMSGDSECASTVSFSERSLRVSMPLIETGT